MGANSTLVSRGPLVAFLCFCVRSNMEEPGGDDRSPEDETNDPAFDHHLEEVLSKGASKYKLNTKNVKTMLNVCVIRKLVV